MSCKATNTTCDDHWSTKSNISITSSSDGAHSPKSSSRSIFRKLSRLSKISSLASLFSTKSSNSYDSGGGGDSSGCSSSYDIKQQNNNNNINNCNHRLRKPYSSNSAIFTAASHQANDKHRHISYTCSDFADFSGEIHAPMMHDQQQLSFAASLPVISPLLNENDHHHHHHHHHNQQSNTTNDRNNMSNDADQVSSFEPKNNAPQILITQPSFTEENRTKFGSLRWLRNASFRRRRRRAGNDEAEHKQTDLNEKNPIELPPTVLFPNETYSITTGSESQTINSSSNSTSNTSSRSASPFPLADQQPRSFGQMLSHLEAVNHRRSSLYSQQSFDSIDSRLSIVDDSTLEDDYASPSRLAQSIAKNRPSPARIPMIIDDDADRDRVSRAQNSFTSMHGGGCGGTANMTKAKSDTHLYFCLDEAEPPNQSAQDDDVFENETKFFADKMAPENGSKRDDAANVPPATPLKRNSNRRSLYARFISAKRKNQPDTSTTVTQHKPTLTECTTNMNSFKQRFRFRYSSKTRPAPSDCDHDHPHLAHPHQRSLSQSKNRASEPFRINVLHHEPAARVMRREQRVPLPPISSKSEANLLSAGLQQKNNNNNNNDNGFQPPLVDGVLRHTKLANECFMHENARNLSGASASPPLTADIVSNSELSTQAQYGDGSTDMKSDEQRQLDAASNGYGDRDGQISELAPTEVMGSTSRPESHASQPRESRSLIRTIRKRLSFSKRSKSVERQPNSFRERSVASVDDERARSVPGSREPSAPREMANGKKQESYLSLASNTSFFAENSTLVLECVVNGEKRHYLVPFSQANKRKYRRRKGVKLHVHNDHLFVAQHVPSSNECQVCAKSFPLRIGKQGYQCRECGFLTHKQCHALAESFCPANGAAKLNFDLDNSDTPKRVPSPLPEVRVIAPSEGSPINEKEII